MKGHWRSVLKIVLFVIIFLMLSCLLGKLFQPVWLRWNNYNTTRGFYEEPDNTIEALFIGSSVGVEGISPMRLYETRGLCTYNLCTEQQPMVATLHWLEEAYLHHPKTLKTVVFDVSSIRNEDKIPYARKAIDGLRLSPRKAEAVWEYAGKDLEETITYLSPLLAYHSRWESLGQADLDKFTYEPVNGTRGFNFIDTSRVKDHRQLGTEALRTLRLNTEAKPAELVQASVDYMDRIHAFCQEKGLKLVLIKTPVRSWNASLHMAVEALATRYGLEFYDFNFAPYYNDINCFMPFDAHDNTHFNYFGAMKLTDWLGDYLAEQCGTGDVRGKAGYEHMDAQYEQYRQTVLPGELKSATDPIDYLKLAAEAGRKVTLTAHYGATAAMTDGQIASLEEMGLAQLMQLKEGETYTAVLEKGALVSQKVSPAAAAEAADGSRPLKISVADADGRKAVDTAVFPTDTAATRETYGADTIALLQSGELSPVPGGLYESISLYQQRQQLMDALKDQPYTDVCSFLADHIQNEDSMIFIAVRNEASRGLTKKVRATLKGYGLTELSQIAFRDSYLGVIDGGTVVKEMRSQDALAYEMDAPSVQLKSAGFNTGEMASSLLIKGAEFSPDKRGLNIAVYDKKTGAVIAIAHFDTYLRK